MSIFSDHYRPKVSTVQELGFATPMQIGTNLKQKMLNQATVPNKISPRFALAAKRKSEVMANDTKILQDTLQAKQEQMGQSLAQMALVQGHHQYVRNVAQKVAALDTKEVISVAEHGYNMGRAITPGDAAQISYSNRVRQIFELTE